MERAVADVKGRLGTGSSGRGIKWQWERRRELWQGLVELEGEEREVEREVYVQDKGEAVDVDETDNEDTGAGAEDEEMALQEEQRNAGVVRERIPETSIPAASASASTPTPPYRCQPNDDKLKSMKRNAARPAPQTWTCFALRTPLPCRLSRAVVQEPYDPPNVPIRHRSRVAHASYAPTDQAGCAKR